MLLPGAATHAGVEAEDHERRKVGRRRKTAVTIDVVIARARAGDRRGITVFDVAGITGFSKSKVYDDIDKYAQLAAVRVRCGHSVEYRINCREAVRYFAKMGLLTYEERRQLKAI